ncbi:hypothetical protein SAMN00790413_06379 [Deinococcus hopiensis KR-140]|uniref:Uncharacterized protein n=1 Tax=Deinococcus hopiensis KR-140 TaxID=695939 RepID=A0A1W1VV71_9DEIO|nr:hypothetical protein SAMN00790413_06379 [Deinococcus hopiensis KR-140]
MAWEVLTPFGLYLLWLALGLNGGLSRGQRRQLLGTGGMVLLLMAFFNCMWLQEDGSPGISYAFILWTGTALLAFFLGSLFWGVMRGVAWGLLGMPIPLALAYLWPVLALFIVR